MDPKILIIGHLTRFISFLDPILSLFLSCLYCVMDTKPHLEPATVGTGERYWNMHERNDLKIYASWNPSVVEPNRTTTREVVGSLHHSPSSFNMSDTRPTEQGQGPLGFIALQGMTVT